ncbi:MAG TPA: CvpA family protein [Nevskiaceae bacterium]|nr:CvpA family protein [Nevskiaceae bacterium]
MNWADYSILALILLSALIGALRGFTRESLGLATWIVAILVAVLFGKAVAASLESHIAAPLIRVSVAYGGLFLAALLIGGIVTAIIVSRVRESRFSSADRTAGAGLGLIRGAVTVALLVMVGMMTTVHEATWWKESRLIAPAQTFATALRSIIPDEWLAPLENKKPAAEPTPPAGEPAPDAKPTAVSAKA